MTRTYGQCQHNHSQEISSSSDTLIDGGGGVIATLSYLSRYYSVALILRYVIVHEYPKILWLLQTIRCHKNSGSIVTFFSEDIKRKEQVIMIF